MIRIEIVTDEAQEALAVALEEAAERVRQSRPSMYEFDVRDDVDMINIGNGTIPGMRSPSVRRFDIQW